MEPKDSYDQPLYSISIAAKILNVSVHTLRMYEREGLIVPYKKESNHRLYSQSDIDRLNCIRKAINEFKISINGIRTLYSFIPCWNIVKCPENERNTCEAFSSHTSPCWTFEHKNNSCSNAECRECAAYKNYTECKSIKESIINMVQVKEIA